MEEKELIKTYLKAQAIYDANNTMMSVSDCAKFLGSSTRTILRKVKSNDSDYKIIAKYTNSEWKIPKIQFLEKLVDEFK